MDSGVPQDHSPRVLAAGLSEGRKHKVGVAGQEVWRKRKVWPFLQGAEMEVF